MYNKHYKNSPFRSQRKLFLIIPFCFQNGRQTDTEVVVYFRN